MKKILILFLTTIMLFGNACAAVPNKLLSSDDALLTSTQSDSKKTIYVSEYAYVRGNDYKNKNWHDILAERNLGDMLIIKNGHKVSSSTRYTYLRFDISPLTVSDVGRAELALDFTKIQADADVPFKVFAVSNDWKENEITYSTQPAKLDGTPIADEVIFKKENADVTAAIRSALQKGEKYVSLMILQSIETISETQIEFSKISDAQMPRLIISADEGLPSGSSSHISGIDSAGRLYTSEYAYVRGNDYKDKNWHDILAERNLGDMLIIKNGHKVSSSTRYTYLIRI